MKRIISILLVFVSFFCVSCSEKVDDYSSENNSMSESNDIKDNSNNDVFLNSYDMLNTLARNRIIYYQDNIKLDYKQLYANYILSPLRINVKSKDIFFDVIVFDDNYMIKDTIYSAKIFNSDENESFCILMNCNFKENINEINFSIEEDYFIDSKFNIEKVNFSYLGNLSFLQSFSFYNSNYYSSDGKNLGIQNESLVSIGSIKIETGHSNSMQISPDGKAYISGWDDNRIYIVDLDNFNTEIIELPINGYSTCAFDFYDKKAYIFYRSTYPTTNEFYRYMIYNFETKEIIDNKTLNFEFMVQQSCYYYDGYIYLLWGGSTYEYSNGFVVIDEKGNMVESFHLNTFESYEPEGIYIQDRNNIYISYSNLHLYHFCVS